MERWERRDARLVCSQAITAAELSISEVVLTPVTRRYIYGERRGREVRESEMMRADGMVYSTADGRK